MSAEPEWVPPIAIVHTPVQVRDDAGDCPRCQGSGWEVCGACHAKDVSCDHCEDGFVACEACAGEGIDAFWLVAQEANRLWRRDRGRDIFVDQPDLYIGWAIQAYQAGELRLGEGGSE